MIGFNSENEFKVSGIFVRKLLFLVHRLPYPPNKGDKISSYNMLRFFCQRWQVSVGAFIDDPEDWRHATVVEQMSQNSYFVPLRTTDKLFASLISFFSGKPISVEIYNKRAFRRWIQRQIRENRPDAILVYSGAMAQFVAAHADEENIPFVFNLEDVDSEKWRAYAEQKRPPMSWVYRREARRLLSFERAMAQLADATILISQAEAELFRQLCPESADKIHNRHQGVDSDFFRPDCTMANPYEPGEKVFVFTGAMDYWPNVEAVTWFCDHVLAEIRAEEPSFTFYIVGMRPAPEVLRLAERGGVKVTGAVEDVRPYLQHAIAACLPLRIARGIQNKALEALSMELPVLATPEALTGIVDDSQEMIIMTADEARLRKEALALLAKGRQANRAGRELVLAQFDWEANLRKLEKRLLSAIENVNSCASGKNTV